MRRLALSLLFFAINGVITPLANAIDQPRVLPAKIRWGFISLGQYYGLNQYYTDEGELKNLADKNSFVLDSNSVSAVNSAFSDLVRVLNEFGHSSLGSQLHLGRIQVQANPSVRFYAPTLAYGLTKKWTVGAALPIISYRNDIQIQQSGSNIDYARNQIGAHVPEINDAFTQLDNEVAKGINGTLADKGYKPLSSRDESFLGDAVLFAAYLFDPRDQSRLKTSLRFQLNLPTGPEADPDDLADLETFGRYSLRTQWLAERILSAKWSAIGEASYLLVPAQGQTKRVPRNSSDNLPDANSRYDLTEDLGDTLGLSTGLAYTLSSDWTFAANYGYQYKLKDRFSGGPSARTHYLEEGTERSAHVVKAQASYSTVQKYLSRKAMIPGAIDYEIAKTIAGENIENQFIHTLTFSLFF